MNIISLPALGGETPLGILAAMGTMRLLNCFTDRPTSLSWDPENMTARLHTSHGSLDAVIADLNSIAEGVQPRGCLPGIEESFPPAGETTDGLRLPPADLRRLVETSGLNDQDEMHRWLCTLVTDLAFDDKGRSAISQLTAPAGRQTMATMLTKPLELVRSTPEYLAQALTGWRRVPGVTGENLDSRAIWNATDDGRGRGGSMRGVPGATWLALMSFPLFLTTATAKGRPSSSGWHTVRSARRSCQEFRLPVWTQPIGPAAVTALVEHPALSDLSPAGLRDLARLGVVHVCRSRRYQLPGSQSAGILQVV